VTRRCRPVPDDVEAREVDWGKVVRITTDVLGALVLLWMLSPPLRVELAMRVSAIRRGMSERKAARLTEAHMNFQLHQIRSATPEQIALAVKELAA
jgi:hypothetical protein